MPANAATLELEQAHADALKALGERAVRQVADRYRAINPEALDLGFRSFLPAAASIIETHQALAQRATQDFMARQHFLELGTAWAPSTTASQVAGTTIDGRAIQSALASVPPAVLTTIKQGRPINFALARGLHVAARIAATETADAARRETDHQMIAFPDIYSGWQWVARGTCPACLAKMNNNVIGNSADPVPLNGHPGCTCIKSPTMFKAQNTVQRLKGSEKFNALSPDEQAALFKSQGALKAQAIREGRLNLDDLLDKQTMKQWRSMITERNTMPNLRHVPTVRQDAKMLDSMTKAFRAKVSKFLGPKGAQEVDDVASAVCKRAAGLEKSVTKGVVHAGDKSGAVMKGLDFRLKGQGSMARKIGTDMMTEGKTVAQVGDDIGDSIRYTMTFKPEAYWKGVDDAVEDLLAQGYRPYKWKDLWGTEYYRGINSNWYAPNGAKIEIQFHTPKSFWQKEVGQHHFYEVHRISDDILQQERLEARMAEAWGDKITRPPGQRGIGSMDDILGRAEKYDAETALGRVQKTVGKSMWEPDEDHFNYYVAAMREEHAGVPPPPRVPRPETDITRKLAEMGISPAPAPFGPSTGLPNSIETLLVDGGDTLHIYYGADGLADGYVQINAAGKEISSVATRQTGKGTGKTMYDMVQDTTPTNLYKVIGSSDDFTPAGKAFATSWLQHRLGMLRR